MGFVCANYDLRNSPFDDITTELGQVRCYLSDI